MELTVAHTLGFILFASAMLVVLFVFKLSSAVVALYCVSASGAAATVIFAPAVQPIIRRIWGTPDGRIIQLGRLVR